MIKLLKAIKKIYENMVFFIWHIFCASINIIDSLPYLMSIFASKNTIEDIIIKRRQYYTFNNDIILSLLVITIFLAITSYSPNI